MNVLEQRKRVDQFLIKLETANEKARQERKHLVDSQNASDVAQDAHQLVQVVAKAVQEEAHDRIASVVSQCLEAVFDEPYQFEIDFEMKRGRTEASLFFVRGDISVDPMTASGGGVVDVAAFALRLACMVLLRPPVRRLLVLDEPWKHLSSEYRPRMRELVETLSKEMGVQFIIVTHSNEFKIGKVISL